MKLPLPGIARIATIPHLSPSCDDGAQERQTVATDGHITKPRKSLLIETLLFPVNYFWIYYLIVLSWKKDVYRWLGHEPRPDV